MHALGPLTAVLFMLSNGEADVAEPPGASGPPPASTTEVVADTPPERPKPRFKGTGLLATTAVVGGASLGVTIARSALLKKNCPLDNGTASQCTYDFGSDIGLAATQWSLNFATIGLAAGTGVVMGRYHAWKDASEGRVRKAKTIKVVGGSLLGVGIAGLGTSVALAFVLPTRCLDKELETGDPLAGDRCLLKAFPAWTMTNWASFAMISSGGAMLGYGSNYAARRGKVAQLRLTPYAGPTYAGLGMSGRF